MDNIETVIRDHLQEEFMFRRPEITLHGQLDLIREGILDSLGILRLMNFLEERFNLTFEPTEVVAENFQTLDAVRGLVATKLKAQGKSA